MDRARVNAISRFSTRTRARGRVIRDNEMEDNEDTIWDRDMDWNRDWD